MVSGNSSPQPINLSRLHWPVTTLGYGKRVGIWFQGCSIGCKGCCARDTWQAEESTMIMLGAVLEWVARQPLEKVDGFTISGGEPFDQPEALGELVGELRSRYCDGSARDILVYSGYPWRTLKRRHWDMISEMDVVISEPFVSGGARAWLRGSNNQEIHLVTDLARERYSPGPSDSDQTPSMQVHYDGEVLWMIGIPRPDDLARLEEKLRVSGITLGDVSWRS